MTNLTTRMSSCASKLAIGCALIAAPFSSSAAQTTWLTPAEIGQVFDEVLPIVLPPGGSLSQVHTADRRIRFDHARTMAAFGYVSRPTRAMLRLRSAVDSGDKSLLSDCDPAARKPCSQLGWNAYVWMEPVSMSNSQMQVRVHVLWADRKATFAPGVSPSGKAYLTMFTAHLYLERVDSRWRFVKEGPTAVSD
jgi:hypothetical protein